MDNNIRNIKNKIHNLENKIHKLMITEKQKHLYFIKVYFKKVIYTETTQETRKKYLLEFLKNSYSNYIASQIIENDKEHYNILINNYDKELIINMCLRITDTIATTQRIYIDSKNKNLKNEKLYLTKILNHRKNFIIKNNLEINNITYSKDKNNKFNETNIKLKYEKNKLLKQVLSSQLETLKANSNKNRYKIYKKRHSFYKYDINKIQTEQNRAKYNNNLKAN